MTKGLAAKKNRPMSPSESQPTPREGKPEARLAFQGIPVGAELGSIEYEISAFQVDLLGQVNAETVGGFQVAGVGGQLDFLRGASLAEDALAIIVLDSTTSDGSVSRIVPALERGAVVTSTRYDVDYVITEHGAAQMRGQTTRERARALVEIAHPKFREDLRRAARELVLL